MAQLLRDDNMENRFSSFLTIPNAFRQCTIPLPIIHSAIRSVFRLLREELPNCSGYLKQLTQGAKMVWRHVRAFGLIVFLAVCWGPPIIDAQDISPSHRLDLQACIDRALEVNPQMAESRFDVEESEAQLQSAKLARTGRWSFFNRSGVTNDAVGDAVSGETISGEYGPFNRLNLAVSVPLYTFGKLSNSIQAASENVDRQRASQYKSVSELILEVHKRYYGLVLARELLKTAQGIKSNFDGAFEVAEERLDKGDPQVTETDALKLRVGLAVVTKNFFTVQRQVRVAKAALREVLVFDNRIEFDITDKKLKEIVFESKAIEQYLQIAEKNNPDINQIKAAMDAEEAQYQAERSKYYPTVLAIGAVRQGVAPGRDDQDNPYLNDEYNFFDAGAALGIRWNLNFFQTNSEVNEKRVSYLRMKSRLQKVLNGIALKVKQKYHQYIERKNSLESAFEAKKAGRALLFLNLTNFKLGMGSGRDVFDALSLHARVDGDYDMAIFDYNMAVVELLDVIGKLAPNDYINP